MNGRKWFYQIMKRISFYCFITLICVRTTLWAQINTPSTASVLFGSNATYSGTYIIPTNLPSGGQYGSSQEAADAYNQWKTTYVESCGGTPIRYRVKYDTPAETVSEGIAYGMLLAAYAADKDLFDGLWEYYKDFRDANGLMNWKTNGCSGAIGNGGATDADEDAAMALLVASCQWAGITIPHNYTSDAIALITAISNTEIQPDYLNGAYQPICGDLWGYENTCRNPSYMAPAFYKMFGVFLPSQMSLWNNVIAASYSLLNNNMDSNTGLVSNWCDYNGTPNTCNGPNEYGWDACRNPWRMGIAAAWFGDTDAQNICNKISNFVNTVGVNNLKGPLPLSGGAGSYHSPAFISTWAVGVMGSNSSYQDVMNAIYTETVNVQDPLPYYFGNTLRVLGLFAMTGNFWKPEFNTGLREINADNSIIIYPSPASDNIKIESSGLNKDATISIYNNQGQLLMERPLLQTKTEINISNLSVGMYFIEVKNEKGVVVKKFVKE